MELCTVEFSHLKSILCWLPLNKKPSLYVRVFLAYISWIYTHQFSNLISPYLADVIFNPYYFTHQPIQGSCLSLRPPLFSAESYLCALSILFSPLGTPFFLLCVCSHPPFCPKPSLRSACSKKPSLWTTVHTDTSFLPSSYFEKYRTYLLQSLRKAYLSLKSIELQKALITEQNDYGSNTPFRWPCWKRKAEAS